MFIVVDSVAALVSKAEIEGEMGDRWWVFKPVHVSGFGEINRRYQ